MLTDYEKEQLNEALSRKDFYDLTDDQIADYLEKGCNPNFMSHNTSGWNNISLTFFCLMTGKEHLLEKCLEKGGKADETFNKSENGERWSFLIEAARQGSVRMVKSLLAHGANPVFVSKRGRTAYSMAVNDECRSLIRDAVNDKLSQERWDFFSDYQFKPYFDSDCNPETKSIDSAIGCSLTEFCVRNEKSDLVNKCLEHGGNANGILDEGTESEKSYLMWAATCGNVDIVKHLLEYGADPMYTNKNGQTAFSVATNDDVRMLIRKRVSEKLSQEDFNNLTDEQIADYLNKGGDPNTLSSNTNNWGKISLTCFCLVQEKTDLLRKCFEYGGKAAQTTYNAENNEYWNFLMFAAEQGNVEMVQDLLDYGVDPNFTSNSGKTPFSVAANDECRNLIKDAGIKTINKELVKQDFYKLTDEQIADYLDRGVDPNVFSTATKGWKHICLTSFCIETEKEDLLEKCLEKGGNANATFNGDDGISSYFMRAAEKGNKEMMETLLDYGADPTFANETGKTAVSVAANDEIRHFVEEEIRKYKLGKKLNKEVFENLTDEQISDYLDNGVRPDTKMQGKKISGYPLTFYCVYGEKADLLKKCLEKDGDAEGTAFHPIDDEEFDENWNYLMWAAEKGNAEIVKTLLKYDANPNFTSNSGRTPSSVAANDECRDLIEKGKEIYALNKQLSKEDFENLTDEQINEYLDKGCDPNTSSTNTGDWEDISLISFCVIQEKAELLEKCLEHGGDPNEILENEEEEERTLLMDAAQNGNARIVKILLDHGADPTATCENGEKLVPESFNDECRMLIEDALLNYKDRKNKKDEKGVFTMERKTEGGLVKFEKDRGLPATTEEKKRANEILKKMDLFNLTDRQIEAFLDLGCDPNVKSNANENWEDASLIAACVIKQKEMLLEKCLKNGGNPNEIINEGDEEEQTLLMKAASDGNPKIVKVLLEHGADPFYLSVGGHTASTMASNELCYRLIEATKQHLETKKYEEVEKKEALIRAKDERKKKEELQLKMKKIVAYIHRKKMMNKIKSMPSKMISSVRQTVSDLRHDLEVKRATKKLSRFNFEKGTQKAFEELIAAGADVDILDKNEQPIIIKAANAKKAEMVEVLLDNGANPNVQNAQKWTALMYMATLGRDITVQKLFDKGADANLQNTYGKNALMYAAGSKRERIVKMLCENQDIELDMQDNDGHTALFYAVKSGSKNIVEMLIDAGADINICTKKNESPLMFAASTGKTEIFELLLKHHAKTDVMNNDGKNVCDVIKDEKIKGILERYVSPEGIRLLAMSSQSAALKKAAQEAAVKTIE